MSWKYDYLVDQIHRTAYKKHESFIVGSLIHDPELDDLMPCTQFYVNRTDGGYALLDLFYPQINLAIEIDEPAHENNTVADNERQNIVEEKLECMFCRVQIQQGNVLGQIQELKNTIKILREKAKKDRGWKDWEEPFRLSLSEAKFTQKNTLFLKIKGEIPPEELLARQTGYWRIDKRKQQEIKTVIVVHDSVVTKVFGKVQWHVWEENPQKVGYTGEAVESNIKLGTIIEGWDFQQTVTYSNDVY
ncbi:AbaSI family restriction endonuclease [Sulfurimonas sp.]|uniref:AbaSI family restriction endonuclease n=1 Tax=Sulfurimonas sp. TaxID=2022749 RepID=UPI003D0C9AA9